VIAIDEFGKSSVPGVYAAGDASSLMHQSIAAAASGAIAAAAINGELNQEAWQKTQ